MDIQINKLASETSKSLEMQIQNHLNKLFTAISLVIIHRGEYIYQGAWGWIDPGAKQYPVTCASLFDLASVTKLFTETAFLSLVSQGAVRLDDALVSVIPEFGASGPRGVDGGQDPHTRVMLPTPSDTAEMKIDPALVTFRQLITHTSGLAPWRDVFNAAGPAPTAPTQPDPTSREERWARAVDALCNYPFVGYPGDMVRYSDLGLLLLGESAARLYSQSGELDKAIQELVLQPLGLSSIIFNPVRNGCDTNTIVPTENDLMWRNRRCWGEVHDENACGVGGVAGHAGLFAQATDIAQFGQAWLERDERLQISRELMDEATRYHVGSGATFRIGYGWIMKADNGDSSAGEKFSPRSYGHTGFTGTSLWIEPERQLVVACLTNRVYYGRDNHEEMHRFRQALHDVIAEGCDS